MKLKTTLVTLFFTSLVGCASSGGMSQLGSTTLPDGSTFLAVQATNKTAGGGGPEGSTTYAFKCEKGQKCEMQDVRFASDENANMKIMRHVTNLGSSFVFGGLGQLLRKPDTSYSQTSVTGGSITNSNKTNSAGGSATGGTGNGGAGGSGTANTASSLKSFATSGSSNTNTNTNNEGNNDNGDHSGNINGGNHNGNNNGNNDNDHGNNENHHGLGSRNDNNDHEYHHEDNNSHHAQINE